MRSLLLSGEQLGKAHLPSDSDIVGCLRIFGVAESFLDFKIADKFRAPGVFDQSHFVMGTSSAGAIKVEEEERGTGSGASYYLFCKEPSVEIYLASYTGNGGEIAILVRGDGGTSDVSDILSKAMECRWPSPSEDTAPTIARDRLAIHRQRLESMRGHVQEWFGSNPNSPRSSMRDIATFSRSRFLLESLLRLPLAAVALAVALFVTPRMVQEEVAKGHSSYLLLSMGIPPLLIGLLLLSSSVRHAGAVFLSGCFMKAGPEGIRFRLPYGASRKALFFAFRVEEHLLPWQEVKKTYAVQYRVNGLPFGQALIIDSTQGRFNFGGYFKESAGSILASIGEISALRPS